MSEAGINESLRFYAKQLKLPTFAHIDEITRKFQTGQSLESFTLDLLKREYASRKENQLKRRIQRAKFPIRKTM